MNAELKALHGPNLGRWLFLALINWAEIILTFVIAHKLNHPAGYVLTWIILGTRLHALALLGHEGIHRCISKNIALNNFLANIFCALPLQQTLNWFTKFHTDHHKHLQEENDPEIHFRALTPNRWSLPLTKTKRMKLLLLDLSGIGVWESANVLRHTFKGLGFLDLAIPVAFWASFWFIFWKLNLLWVPFMWGVVLLTSYWAMFRQRALVEHLGTDDTHRTYATPFERFFFLPHNCWYHYEHHKWQGIPCWNLPAARKLDTEVPVITLPELFSDLARKV